MAVFTREKLSDLLAVAAREPGCAYLFVGDRFLCRQASARLEEVLLADGGTVHALDGDHEDPATTVSRLQSFSLLPGRQIYRISDTRLFHSKKTAKALWTRAVTARSEGKPEAAARHLRAMMTSCGLDPADPDDNPAKLTPAQWKKRFDFPHPGGDLSWITTLISTRTNDKPGVAAAAGKEPAALLQKALESGVAANNTLILLAEEVDKRKAFYRYLKKNQVIVDLSVDKGAGSKAQKAQRGVLVELMTTTIREMGKTMAPGVMDQLLDRIGFYPVAVVMETEKLCLSIGERNRIELDDLNAMVGRTRQEALFELTGAIGDQQPAKALTIAGHLLDDQVHPLAIIATLRNYARRLLLFKALGQQPQYGYTPGMPANIFQRQCLPALKNDTRWKQELSGHPYALYMQFTTASRFSAARLQSWLHLILRAERRLKGSPLDPLTVLHHLLLAMLITGNHDG
ncbi:MAG TPA: DNA polymerase III subunit delta [Desulfobulbaceae bacterium]|nr:DNA polymerase III subunit delta [Desulfobulbaceae bacterium]